MISKRLARLEAALARPAEQPPVDMRPVHARLDFLTAGHGHKGKTALARFAAAMRCSPMRLWRLTATPDRRKFARAYEVLQAPMRHEREAAHRAQQSAGRLAFEDKWAVSPEGKAAMAAEAAKRAEEADAVALVVVEKFLDAGFRWRIIDCELHACFTWPGGSSMVRMV